MKLSSLLLSAAAFTPAGLLPAHALQAQGTRAIPPTNVWAAQTELRGITLVWKRASRAIGYRVYPVKNTPRRGLPTGTTSKTLDRISIPLVPSYRGSYSYQIAAVYPNGVLSKKVPSNTVVPVLKPPPGSIPAPKSVTATETASGVVTVSWTPVGGATGYFIGRSVFPGGLKTICAVCSTEPSYTDRKVTAGAKHMYVVAALTPNGPTGRTRSNEVIPAGSGDGGTGGGDSTNTGGGDSTTTDSTGNAPADSLLPGGVRLFTARNEPGPEGRVRLSWSADPDAARYLIAFVDTVDDAHYGPEELFAERTIYRGTDTATTIAAPGDTARITYAIVSENSHGRSQPRYATRAAGSSPRDSVPRDSTPPDSAGEVASANQLPEGVKNLTATFGPTNALYNFTLRWQPDPRAEHYYISYSVSGGPFQQYGRMVPASDTIARILPPVPSATVSSYGFSIVSENQKGKSPPRYSNVLTGHAPSGPSRLDATAGPTPNVVQLNWSFDPDAAAFAISRSEDDGPFRDCAFGQAAYDNGVRILSVVDHPTSGMNLRYRIITRNWFGTSPPIYSQPIRRPQPPPQYQPRPPAGVTAAVATLMPNGRVRLTWTRDSTAENYQILKSVNQGAFVQLVTLPSDRIDYMDVGIVRGSPPAYQIISTNRDGASAPVAFEQESVESDPIPPKVQP
jgi:hypothetical protein